jgi:hypothetical protein
VPQTRAVPRKRMWSSSAGQRRSAAEWTTMAPVKRQSARRGRRLASTRSRDRPPGRSSQAPAPPPGRPRTIAGRTNSARSPDPGLPREQIPYVPTERGGFQRRVRNASRSAPGRRALRYNGDNVACFVTGPWNDGPVRYGQWACRPGRGVTMPRDISGSGRSDGPFTVRIRAGRSQKRCGSTRFVSVAAGLVGTVFTEVRCRSLR